MMSSEPVFARANYMFVTSRNSYTLPELIAAGSGTTDTEKFIAGADDACFPSNITLSSRHSFSEWGMATAIEAERLRSRL